MDGKDEAVRIWKPRITSLEAERDRLKEDLNKVIDWGPSDAGEVVFQELRRVKDEVDALRAADQHGVYLICAKHPDEVGIGKRDLPCRQCQREEIERLRGLLESLIAYRDHNPRAFVGFSLYPKEWLRVEEALEAVAPKESASREERDDG